MKLYEYIYDKHAKNSPILLEYEVEAEQHDVFYTINSRSGGLRNIPISLIGRYYNGDRLYLNKPDIEKAKTLFVQAINSKIEEYDKSIETLYNERKALLEFKPSTNQNNSEKDDMVQELINYIISVKPRQAYDIIEDVLGREIEFDEVLLDAIEEIWDLPMEKIQESYQKYFPSPVITK